MKRAIVLGATGLVGRELVSLLEADAAVEQVVVLARRAPDRRLAPKTELRVVDMQDPATWGDLGGDLFCSALGTTLRVAGSKAAQYAIDHDLPLAFARAARAAGVGTVGIVSSLGADPSSRSFYTRMKGELDRDIEALGFPRTRIVRPSVLVGERAEERPGERLAAVVLGAIGALPGISRYRPIPVRTVAAALLALAADPAPGLRVADSADLFGLAAAAGEGGGA